MKRLMRKILFKVLKWVIFAIIWKVVAGAIKRKVKKFIGL